MVGKPSGSLGKSGGARSSLIQQVGIGERTPEILGGRKPTQSAASTGQTKSFGGAASVISARISHIESLRPKTVSEETTNKYLNNPQYIVERRDDGSLKRIYKKPEIYIDKIENEGQSVSKSSFIPHELIYNDQGKLISDTTYRTYFKFYDSRDNDTDIEIYKYNEMVFDPDQEYKKSEKQWYLVSKQGKNTSSETPKESSYKEFSAEGQKTKDISQEWSDKYIVRETGDIVRVPYKKSESIYDAATGKETTREASGTIFTTEKAAQQAFFKDVVEKVKSGQDVNVSSMFAKNIKNVLPESTDEKSVYEMLKKSVTRDMGESVTLPGMSITQTLSQRVIPGASGLKKDVTVLDSIKTKIGVPSAETISYTVPTPTQQINEKIKVGFTQPTQNIISTFTNLTPTGKVIQKTTSVGDVLKSIEQPETRYPELAVPTGQFVDSKLAMERLSQLKPNVQEELSTDDKIRQAFSDKQFTPVGWSTKDTTLTKESVVKTEPTQKQKNLATRIAMFNASVKRLLKLPFLQRDEKSVKDLEKERNQIMLVLESEGGGKLTSGLLGSPIKDINGPTDIDNIAITLTTSTGGKIDFNNYKPTVPGTEEPEFKPVSIGESIDMEKLIGTAGVIPKTDTQSNFLKKFNLNIDESLQYDIPETTMTTPISSTQTSFKISQEKEANIKQEQENIINMFDKRVQSEVTKPSSLKRNVFTDANLNKDVIGATSAFETIKLPNKQINIPKTINILSEDIKAYNLKKSQGINTDQDKKYIFSQLATQGESVGNIRYIQADINTPAHLKNKVYDIDGVTVFINAPTNASKIIGEFKDPKIFTGPADEMKETDRVYSTTQLEAGIQIENGEVKNNLLDKALEKQNKLFVEVNPDIEQINYINDDILNLQTKLYGTEFVKNLLSKNIEQQKIITETTPTKENNEILNTLTEKFNIYNLKNDKQITGLLSLVSEAETTYKEKLKNNIDNPTKENYDEALTAYNNLVKLNEKLVSQEEIINEKADSQIELVEKVNSKAKEIDLLNKIIGFEVQDTENTMTAFNTAMKNVGYMDSLKLADDYYKEKGLVKGFGGRAFVAAGEFGRDLTKFVGAGVFEYKKEKDRGATTSKALMYALPGISQVKSVYDWKEDPKYRKVDWETVMGGVSAVAISGAFVKGLQAAKFPLGKEATKIAGKETAKQLVRKGVVKGVVGTGLAGMIVVPEVVQVAQGKETVGGAVSDILKSGLKIGMIAGVAKGAGGVGSQIGKQELIKEQQRALFKALRDPALKDASITTGGKGELFLRPNGAKSVILQDMKPLSVRLGGKWKNYKTEYRMPIGNKIKTIVDKTGLRTQTFTGDLEVRLRSAVDDTIYTDWTTLQGSGVELTQFTETPGGTKIIQGELTPTTEMYGQRVGSSIGRVVQNGKVTGYTFTNTRGIQKIKPSDIDKLSNKQLNEFKDVLGLKTLTQTKKQLKDTIEFIGTTEVGKTIPISATKYESLQLLENQGLSTNSFSNVLTKPQIMLDERGAASRLIKTTPTYVSHKVLNPNTGKMETIYDYSYPAQEFVTTTTAKGVSIPTIPKSMPKINVMPSSKTGSLSVGRRTTTFDTDYAGLNDVKGTNFLTSGESKQADKLLKNLIKGRPVSVRQQTKLITSTKQQTFSPSTKFGETFTPGMLSMGASQYLASLTVPGASLASMLGYSASQLASTRTANMNKLIFGTRPQLKTLTTTTSSPTTESFTRVSSFSGVMPKTVIGGGGGGSGGGGSGGGSGNIPQTIVMPTPPITPGGPFIPGIKPPVLPGVFWWNKKDWGLSGKAKQPKTPKSWIVTNPIKNLQKGLGIESEKISMKQKVESFFKKPKNI